MILLLHFRFLRHHVSCSRRVPPKPQPVMPSITQRRDHDHIQITLASRQYAKDSWEYLSMPKSRLSKGFVHRTSECFDTHRKTRRQYFVPYWATCDRRFPDSQRTTQIELRSLGCLPIPLTWRRKCRRTSRRFFWRAVQPHCESRKRLPSRFHSARKVA